MTDIIQAYEEGKEFGQRMGAAGVWGDVNKLLERAGIEYPKGMKGLRDLVQQREGHLAAYNEQLVETSRWEKKYEDMLAQRDAALAGVREVDDLRMREICELRRELKEYKEMISERIDDEMRDLHEWMKQHSGAGPQYTYAKLNEVKHFLKEGR